MVCTLWIFWERVQHSTQKETPFSQRMCTYCAVVQSQLLNWKTQKGIWPGGVLTRGVYPPKIFRGEQLPPLSSEYHVLWKCAKVNQQRRNTGVSNFKLSCFLKNITNEQSFFMYVNGFDTNYDRVSISVCMTRVNSLIVIRNSWLKQCVPGS